MRRKSQNWFLRLQPFKGWCLIVGESLALVSAALAVIPGVPSKISENAIPWAVIFGAGALLIVAIFEKIDPTTPHLWFGRKDEIPPTDEQRADTIYAWPE